MAQVLEVLKYPDKTLRRGGKDITEIDEGLRSTVADMLATMYSYKGVGLAAPQVGLELNLLVLNPSGDPADTSEEMVLLNPEIISRKTLEWGEEGCLSFPGIYAEVERHKKIVVRYMDMDGETRQEAFGDFMARIVLHEMDHLQGTLFVDRLSPTERIRVRGALTELEEAFKQKTQA